MPRASTSIAVIAHKQSTGTVTGFPDATAIMDSEVLEVPCDVLVPAALENQITGENAARVQARLDSRGGQRPDLSGRGRPARATRRHGGA